MQCHFQHTYHRLGSLPLQKSLVAFGGQRLNAYGKPILNCQHKGKTYPVVLKSSNSLRKECGMALAS